MVPQSNSSFDEDSKAVITDSRWDPEQVRIYFLKFLAHLKPYLMTEDGHESDFLFAKRVGDRLELVKNQQVDGHTLDNIVTMNRTTTMSWRKHTVYIGMFLSCYRSDI